MPEFQLFDAEERPRCDGEGVIRVDAGLGVWSIMVHPSDESARANMLLANLYALASRARERGQPVVNDQALLQSVLACPDLVQDETRKQLTAAPVGNGLLAGEMLIALINLRAFRSDLKPTMDDVIKVFARFYEGRVNARGEQIPASHSFFWSQWSRFKPVAHLWAALGCHYLWGGDQRAIEQAEDPESHVDFLFERTRELLTFSEIFRFEAERHEIFECGEAWRVASDFQPTEAEVQFPCLGPPLLEFFEAHYGPTKWTPPNGFGGETMEPDAQFLELKNAEGGTIPIWHDGELSPLFPGILQAWMLYPQNETDRLRFFQSWFLSELIESPDFSDLLTRAFSEGGSGQVAEMVKCAQATPDFSTAAMEAAPNYSKGMRASMILDFWLRLRADFPETRPRPTAVIWAYSKYLGVLEKEKGQPVGPRSERHLANLWKKYRPVSHFYSAFATLYSPDSMHEVEPSTEREGEGVWIFNQSELFDQSGGLEFLALAEGRRHYVYDAGDRLGRELVAVPESARLQLVPIEIRQELPEEFLEFYRQYRPKHSAT